MSESKLIPILLQIQATMPNPIKSDYSDYTQSHFVPLLKLLEHIKPYLIDNEILLKQEVGHLIVGDKPYLTVESKLIHISGEEYGHKPMVVPLQHNNPQGMGSGITYARRYGLEVLFNITGEEDDDGVAASRSQSSSRSNEARTKRTTATEQPKEDKKPDRTTRKTTAELEIEERVGSDPGKKTAPSDRADRTERSTKEVREESKNVGNGTTTRAVRATATEPDTKRDNEIKPNLDENPLLGKIKEACPILYKKATEALDNSINPEVVTEDWLVEKAQNLLGQELISQDQLGLVKEELDC